MTRNKNLMDIRKQRKALKVLSRIFLSEEWYILPASPYSIDTRRRYRDGIIHIKFSVSSLGGCTVHLEADSSQDKFDMFKEHLYLFSNVKRLMYDHLVAAKVLGLTEEYNIVNLEPIAETEIHMQLSNQPY